MDSEAIQLLNLSPIPELSEFELSTMLDQLSGLSDVNGDLTDRNVEDLLKEAEDLLDKSESSKTLVSKDLNDSPEIEDNKSLISQDMDVLNDNEECNSKQSDVSLNKHHQAPIKNVSHIPTNISPDNNANKHYNSPVGSTPTKIYSPGGSCNHIKSTIDSLREFSTLIEQALSSRCSKSSPQQSTAVKLNEKEVQKEVSISDESVIVKHDYSNQGNNSFKTTKSLESTRKDAIEPHSRSIKLLNCFERLYQDRPVRLLTTKKLKAIDKIPKTVLKKKFSKDLKNIKKSNWPGKIAPKKTIREDVKANGKILEKENDCALKTLVNEEELIKPNTIISQNYFLTKPRVFSPRKKCEKGIENEFFKSNLNGGFQSDCLKAVQSQIEEKLMLKSLEEVDEIKDKMKKVVAEKSVKEDHKGIETPKPEVDIEGEKFSDSGKNARIRRLEEQFSNLKEKYDHQIEKLESENFRLRIALNNQKINAPQINAYTDIFMSADVISTEKNEYKASLLNSPPSETKKNVENVSPENCKTPENSPCDSPENLGRFTTVKEAFSQTEDEVKSACIQCSQECQEIITNGNINILARRKTENKENLALKKKLGKGKPFSDMNVHQLMKQTKAFDRETQLLATLRGLQAEASVKDKENRKLKAEIDSLRRQIKKMANSKVDNCRKCTIGTQTIGLGSIAHKSYNPENYEAPHECEKENDELRSRIKALEEDFEYLKEKRISDLQSLHQVHEEEMAKLVSKLETQSALTRHLHSLLINR